jgi:hypothetical protein
MAMNMLGDAITCRWTVRVAALMAVSLLAGGACSRDRPSRAERAVELVGALPERDLVRFQRCARDEDCTWTTNGCCDCANGGNEIGIARSQETSFKKSLACATKNIPCTMMAIEPACGTGEIKCEASRCVFRSSTELLP